MPLSIIKISNELNNRNNGSKRLTAKLRLLSLGL